MCALSLPVRRHWAMNCVCERFMIAAVVNIEIGTLTNAIRASSGEIQNIIPSTAITVSSEVSSWLIVCCNRSEEHTSELQSLMRISYAVFCLKKKKQQTATQQNT